MANAAKNRLCIPILGVAILLGPTRGALAQENQPDLQPPEEVKLLNQKALEAFKNYSFKTAQKQLQKAWDVIHAHGLQKSDVAAETYMLFGIAYTAGINDLYRGMHYFVQALRINKKSTIPESLNSPQLKMMFEKAKKTLKVIKDPPKIVVAEKRKDDSELQPAVVTDGRGLIHQPIDTAKRGYVIPIKVRRGMDIQANRLLLYFRPAGTVTFSKVPMTLSHGEYRATIPAKMTKGRYIHYYIEALDQRGRLAGSNGSAQSPNVITIQ